MDRATEPPTLLSLFHAAGASAGRQDLCVLALLTWVASCDGTIDPAELELLQSVAAGVPGGREVLPAVIDIGRRARPDDLELACRYLRNYADRSRRPLLAQLFVTMAARDGHLTVAENHVLRFLADLLGLPARKFAKLFERVTHRPFPEVGDVSSLEWWRRREAGGQAEAPADGWGRDRAARSGPGAAARPAGPWDRRSDAPGASGPAETSPPPAAEPMTRARALRVLALPEGASRDDIHRAYLRLAKARHPDRFARLGPAAQVTAAAAFQLVHDAYQALTAA